LVVIEEMSALRLIGLVQRWRSHFLPRFVSVSCRRHRLRALLSTYILVLELHLSNIERIVAEHAEERKDEGVFSFLSAAEGVELPPRAWLQ